MLKIGVFADLHYGKKDVADRMCTRGAEKLRLILDKFRGRELIVNMGDLINGDPSRDVNEELFAELKEIMNGYPVENLVGNHDGFHLAKDLFREVKDPEIGAVGRIGTGDGTLIIIDPCFFTDGRPYDGHGGDWRDTICPEKQLAWLEKQLSECDKAVVLSHHPLVSLSGEPETWTDTHLPQNARDVMNIIERSGNVTAVIAGHNHTGGTVVHRGILHITVPAVCTWNHAVCADVILNKGLVTYVPYVLGTETKSV